jgi:uncharacterized protein
MSARDRIAVDDDALAALCRRWRVRELSAFGSVLRDDFRDDSDVDLLVSFEGDAQWSLLDIVRMERELAELVRRPVDLVSRRAVEESRNYIRRSHILSDLEALYVAG